MFDRMTKKPSDAGSTHDEDYTKHRGTRRSHLSRFVDKLKSLKQASSPDDSRSVSKSTANRSEPELKAWFEKDAKTAEASFGALSLYDGDPGDIHPGYVHAMVPRVDSSRFGPKSSFASNVGSVNQNHKATYNRPSDAHRTPNSRSSGTSVASGSQRSSIYSQHEGSLPHSPNQSRSGSPGSLDSQFGSRSDPQQGQSTSNDSNSGGSGSRPSSPAGYTSYRGMQRKLGIPPRPAASTSYTMHGVGHSSRYS